MATNATKSRKAAKPAAKASKKATRATKPKAAAARTRPAPTTYAKVVKGRRFPKKAVTVNTATEVVFGLGTGGFTRPDHDYHYSAVIAFLTNLHPEAKVNGRWQVTPAMLREFAAVVDGRIERRAARLAKAAAAAKAS